MNDSAARQECCDHRPLISRTCDVLKGDRKLSIAPESFSDFLGVSPPARQRAKLWVLVLDQCRLFLLPLSKEVVLLAKHRCCAVIILAKHFGLVARQKSVLSLYPVAVG
jgi:hypothetical protein